MEQYKTYLDSSQAVRRLIESYAGLKELANRTLSSRSKKSGHLHCTFSLGAVQDVPLAIRSFLSSFDRDYMQADLEYCARKYAKSVGGRYRVPGFAIGAIIGIIPYLFTEDLTEGGKNTIVPAIDWDGFLKHTEQEVLFDFGLEDLISGRREKIQARMLSQPLFFAPKNLLRIK